LTGIPAALTFLEGQRLPDEVVERSTYNSRRDPRPGSFVAARFIHPDTGEPQYVHREGTNVFNGRYVVDDQPEGTIAHYNSFTMLNPTFLRQIYEQTLALPREELAKESPFLNTGLVPLRKYYTRVRSRYGAPEAAMTEADVRALLGSLTEQGYWLSEQRQTSNPYQACPTCDPCTSREYTSTFVGDEYDTSPYTAEEPVQCISVRTYIENMAKLIRFLDPQQ